MHDTPQSPMRSTMKSLTVPAMSLSLDQLVERDRQIANATAGCVVHSIAKRSCNTRDADLADAPRAKWIELEIGLIRAAANAAPHQCAACFSCSGSGFASALATSGDSRRERNALSSSRRFGSLRVTSTPSSIDTSLGAIPLSGDFSSATTCAISLS